MKARELPERSVWPGESPTRKYVRKWLGKRSVREMAEDRGISTQSVYLHVKAIREEERAAQEAAS